MSRRRARPAGDLVGLVDDERARADEAHVAAEHVQQLRELVEAVAPKEAADARDARVALLRLEQRAVDLVQVQHVAARCASAPTCIVRNFAIVNSLPLRPRRGCR